MNKKSNRTQINVQTENLTQKNIIKQDKTIHYTQKTPNLTSYADIAKGKVTATHTHANNIFNGLPNDYLQKLYRNLSKTYSKTSKPSYLPSLAQLQTNYQSTKQTK